jgi:BirA family biotin operon repressor/biotin-[acetyl-CoA-carboxylase] ligase
MGWGQVDSLGTHRRCDRRSSIDHGKSDTLLRDNRSPLAPLRVFGVHWPTCSSVFALVFRKKPIVHGRIRLFAIDLPWRADENVPTHDMIDLQEVQILRQLRRGTEALSLEALSENAGVSISQVERLLESLCESGFFFNRTDGSVRLLCEPDSLVPQSIMARLETKIIGREVLVFRETSSTNDLARQAGEGGVAEGIVFFAEYQTGGRGTQGRKWISHSNQGLWFSILLRSPLPFDEWPFLVQMAIVAVAETIERRIKEPVAVKAPNDLYLGGGKLGGFLLETSNGWDFQVLGIGVNVRSSPQIRGYPTVALDQFTKAPNSMSDLAAELLTGFEDWYLGAPLEAVARAFAVRQTD